MHVRFERPLIARFFTAGFVLACSLYLVILTALGVVAIRGG
jgi:cell division protein FtsL